MGLAQAVDGLKTIVIVSIYGFQLSLYVSIDQENALCFLLSDSSHAIQSY